MVNRFTIVRPGGPLPKSLLPDNQQDNKDNAEAAETADATPATADDKAVTANELPTANPPVERFQTEIYKAMEILGRKLERAQEENVRLMGRLVQLESAATVDEKTGRLYLPAVVKDQEAGPAAPFVAKSTFAASAISVVVAFLALGLAYFHQAPSAPVGTVLTKEQLAALNTITERHMTGGVASSIEPGKWQSVDNFNEPTAPVVEDKSLIAQDKVDTKDTAIASGLKPDTDPAIGGIALKPGLVAAAPVTAVETAPIEKKAAAAPVASAAAQEQQADEPAATSETPAYNVVERDTNLPANLQKIEKRAFDGVAEAQHDLATIYAAGKAVPQDYKRAVYWFSRAADGGIANAHYNLGVMFQQGLGLKKDQSKAIGWYKSAAELGHPEAMYNLGIAYIDGVGVAQNIERGAAYFKRAAAAGVAQAAYNLGVLYESGFLGAIDLDQAQHWYTEAKNKKHPEANEAIARIKKLKQSASKLPPNLPADAVDSAE